MWTASVWQGLFWVLTGWSAAGMCPAFDCGLSHAAGHDEVREIRFHTSPRAFRARRKADYPDPGFDPCHHTISTSPTRLASKTRNALCQFIAVLKLVSFVIKAHTIRAILLARATAATFAGFRSSNSVAHSVEAAFDLRPKRRTAVAPITSKRRI